MSWIFDFELYVYVNTTFDRLGYDLSPFVHVYAPLYLQFQSSCDSEEVELKPKRLTSASSCWCLRTNKTFERFRFLSASFWLIRYFILFNLWCSTRSSPWRIVQKRWFSRCFANGVRRSDKFAENLEKFQKRAGESELTGEWGTVKAV